MKDLRQVILGIVIALVSIGLIFGAFSLSLSEGSFAAVVVPTDTLVPTLSPTLLPVTPTVVTSTPSPDLALTLTSTWTSTWTLTRMPNASPSPTACIPPQGWQQYIVKSGETLDIIAARFRVSVVALQQANCLSETEALLAGQGIFVPPLPTQTPIPCGRPSGWIVYIIQPGDTLYHLSWAFGVSVAELQQANCMGNSTLLQQGHPFYVPPWPTRTPSPTWPVPIFPTDTPTVPPATGLPTDTPTPSSTATEPLVPTATEPPTLTPTVTLTPTGP
jgi:LysM repeat protein